MSGSIPEGERQNLSFVAHYTLLPPAPGKDPCLCHRGCVGQRFSLVLQLRDPGAGGVNGRLIRGDKGSGVGHAANAGGRGARVAVGRK